MSAETRTVCFPERVMRQVRLDAQRAIIRAKFCPDRSELTALRCMDNRRETDDRFGSQLWYFEGTAVDELDRRMLIFGVVEYSIQFGLNEWVEDGIFDSASQRDRFQSVYHRERLGPSWRHPGHRWLLAGLIAVTISMLGLVVHLLAR